MLLLAAPLNSVILRSLAAGPKQLLNLQRDTDLPAQTTLRSQLKRLVDAGVIGKHRRDRFPGVLEYELTGAGEDLLLVVDVLDRWLDRCADNSLELGGGAAKAAIKALVEGWSTTMLRALAGTFLSLTELDRLIGSLSYPSLERRLAAMRLAGLVEARCGEGRATPYTITDWAREGMAPLAAASKWELQHVATPVPISGLDVEAAFLLVAPLLRLPDCPSGACRLAVDIGDGLPQAGLVATVADGNVVACTTHLEGDADAWTAGTATDWLQTVTGQGDVPLTLGGRSELARCLVAGLRSAYSAFLPAKSAWPLTGRPQSEKID